MGAAADKKRVTYYSGFMVALVRSGTMELER